MSDFRSPEHLALVMDVVRENPPKAGERLMAYLERIAIEAALMKPEPRGGAK